MEDRKVKDEMIEKIKRLLINKEVSNFNIIEHGVCVENDNE